MSPEPQKRDWDSCPTGLISKTAELKLETPVDYYVRRRRIYIWGTASLALLLMLVSYSLIDAEPHVPVYDAAVNCQTVRGNLQAFCNNQIHEASLKRDIASHLLKCKACNQEYHATRNCSQKCPGRNCGGITKPCIDER